MSQRAVARRLEALDEQDGDDGSYGVRPGRRPPEARDLRRARIDARLDDSTSGGLGHQPSDS
jgi:hypothetical protein